MTTTANNRVLASAAVLEELSQSSSDRLYGSLSEVQPTPPAKKNGHSPVTKSNAVFLQIVAGAEFEQMIDLTRERHLRYCERHGIEYRFISGTDPKRIQWEKLEVIRRIMDDPTVEYIFHIDSDALMANMDVDLRAALPDWAWFGLTAHAFPVPRDPFHLNVGVMYFRNTEQSRTFLDKWLSYEHDVALQRRLGFQEQGIVNSLLLDHREWQSGFCLLGHEWNANVHEGWGSGVNVAAFHGADNRVERLARLLSQLEDRPVTVAADVSLVDRLHRAYVATEKDDPETAEFNFRAILNVDPDQHEAVRHYAVFLCKQGRNAEALQWLKWTTSKQAEDTETLLLLANCYYELGQHAAADQTYRRLLALNQSKESAYYRWAYGWFCLGEGRLKEGWEGFRWGYCCNNRRLRHPSPEWDGSYLGPGKRLYICVEMGLGDGVLFERFVRRAKEVSGAWVTLECYEQLVPILMGKTGADEVVAADRDRTFRTPFDVWVNAGTLPMVLGVDTLDDLAPYADPYLVPAGLPGPPAGPLRVGLCWRGSKSNVIDKVRSIDFFKFGPLLEVAGVRLVSLQFRAAREEFRAELAHDLQIEVPDVSTGDKLQAAIDSCDVVVSVDTFVANLCGAMGKPVCVLSRLQSDFRWGHSGDKTPWYPSATVFRQSVPNEWGDVMVKVAEHVAALAAERVEK